MIENSVDCRSLGRIKTDHVMIHGNKPSSTSKQLLYLVLQEFEALCWTAVHTRLRVAT